jgi:hypothetical protein
LCPEEEAPDLHPADALPQALAAWDASDAAHPDEAADAAHLQDLRLEPADAAEKSVGPELGVREQHASHHRSELLVAQGVAETDAPGLCTQVAVRFAEQSCAVRVVAQQLALLQQEAKAERWKPLEPFAQKIRKLQAALLDEPVEHSPAMIRAAPVQQEMLRPVAGPREEPAPEAWKLPLVTPALLPEVQPLPDD